MIELEGKLEEIIFQNETNGYTVGIISTEDEEVTIIGILPALREGENVLVKGKWTVHPNYGRQLEVQEYRPIQPSTLQGMISYLSSGIINGIGEKMAKRIVEKFGDETFEVMQHQPHRLKEVSGIGEAKAEAISEAFKEQWELRDIILFLSQYGITPNYAVKIYKKYGEKTIATLQENPYRLADDIWGIGFKKADEIAKSMGISPKSKYRINAATKYMLNCLHLEGHTYAPRKLLVEKSQQLINSTATEIEEAIQHLALEQKIHIEKYQEDYIIYSMPYYYAEAYSCNKIIELSQVVVESINISLEEELQVLADEENIHLASNQKEALQQALDNGLLVITGGPGTGKTTTINSLLKIFQKQKKKILLAAPTGRASKRMTEATGMEAKTIHRLLELGYSEEEEEMNFQRNEDDPLEADVIIVDEVSMVDILLMNSLLKAVSLGTRLILVGDVDQLPSVGAGNVLKDIIDSNIVRVVRLTEIFRQAQESMIIVNAHKINRGEEPQCNLKGKDFFFMTRNRKEEILKTLVELVKERLPNHYKLDAIKDIQILSPMKKGEVGTINLNKALQENLNPPVKWKQEKEYREKTYRVGDKVMQIKNNYTLKWYDIEADSREEQGEGVFNGDIGYVHAIDHNHQELTVCFDENRLVVYNFNQLDELELAYSVTVHKSQGSEFPVVIMPITWGPPMLLTRNLLYTAITRAKNLVVLVGTENYLNEMIRNDKIVQRYSGLGFRLKKYFDFQRGVE
ncbi:SF1B family DNA helicase RecD2 [Alkaliphilus transvaalensis]|uniref:SF1B family DNA helicase RecD2 n=1 Tax=Alkaliphilus transvaalensis TaxID=114628 RepID=UPI00047AB1ED|nr:ATP-dependent RecD-like DNA helicase [Alkaliphilus transvaalensis]